MNRRSFLSTLLLGGLGVSCDLIKYHPYDGKISGPKNINARNMERIEIACASKDSIRFALMSDTHRKYDELKDFVRHMNERRDIDFVIHGGDIADFGSTEEFIWARDVMEGLTIPYVVLLGNHDCLGNGEQIYHKMFGKENFSFLAGNFRVVCLSTCALEKDYSTPTPDFTFIEYIASQQQGSSERTVVAMHAPPYSDQFDNNVARVFQHYCREFSNLQFFMHGHRHRYEINDIFDDGLLYFGCANIEKRNYIEFSLTLNDYSYEQVWF